MDQRGCRRFRGDREFHQERGRGPERGLRRTGPCPARPGEWGPRSGQSLLSAVIGVGVAMLGLAGVATIITYSQKARNNVTVTADIDNFISILQMQMSDPARCQSLLNSSVQISSTPQALTPASGLTGLPTLPAGVTLVGDPQVQNALTTAAAPRTASWPAQLVFRFQKSAERVVGAPQVTRSVPFLAETAVADPNPAQASITGCVSTGSVSSPQQTCEMMGGTWTAANATNVPPYSASNPKPCEVSASTLSAQSVCETLGGTYTPASGGTAAKCADGLMKLYYCTCPGMPSAYHCGPVPLPKLSREDLSGQLCYITCGPWAAGGGARANWTCSSP